MPPFTCPRCGMVSHGPQDAQEGYCGRCRTFTGRGSASAVTDALEAWEHRERPVHVPAGLLYFCGRCGDAFAVPPGHPEPVLCGSHSPPERMERGIPAPWSRPDADLLADIQEAARQGQDAYGNVYIGPDVPVSEAGWIGPAWGEMIDDSAAAAVAQAMRRTGERQGLTTGDLGGDDSGPEDAQVREIRAGLSSGRPPSGSADGAGIQGKRESAARRGLSLAELAQNVADATPQIVPGEHGPDFATAARWSPDDPGDVIL